MDYLENYLGINNLKKKIMDTRIKYLYSTGHEWNLLSQLDMDCKNFVHSFAKVLCQEKKNGHYMCVLF